jgi:hypothetical protein
MAIFNRITLLKTTVNETKIIIWRQSVTEIIVSCWPEITESRTKFARLQFAVIFTLLHDTFGSLPIKGHNIYKRAAEINLIFRGNNRKVRAVMTIVPRAWGIEMDQAKAAGCRSGARVAEQEGYSEKVIEHNKIDYDSTNVVTFVKS